MVSVGDGSQGYWFISVATTVDSIVAVYSHAVGLFVQIPSGARHVVVPRLWCWSNV